MELFCFCGLPTTGHIRDLGFGNKHDFDFEGHWHWQANAEAPVPTLTSNYLTHSS